VSQDDVLFSIRSASPAVTDKAHFIEGSWLSAVGCSRPRYLSIAQQEIAMPIDQYVRRHGITWAHIITPCQILREVLDILATVLAAWYLLQEAGTGIVERAEQLAKGPILLPVQLLEFRTVE
jgi:hypothetical protein